MAFRVSPPPYGHDEAELRNLAERGAKVRVSDDNGNEVLVGWLALLRGQRDSHSGDRYELHVVFDLGEKLRRAD